MLFKIVEEDYLTPQKVAGLYQGESEEGVVEVARHLLMRKHEFEVEYIDAQATGRRRKRIPYWIIVEAKIQKEMIDLRCDKIHKNALTAIRCEFV